LKTRVLFCLVVLASIFGMGKANAATYYWSGLGGNSNWSNNGNWYGVAFGTYPKTGDVASIGEIVYVGADPTVNTTGLTCATINFGIYNNSVLTVNNAMTVTTINVNSSSTATITGNSLLSATSLAVAGSATFNINAPLTMSGASTTASGAAVNITKTVNTQTLTVIGSTFSVGAALNITGTTGNTLVFTSGSTTFTTNTFTTTVASGGTLQLTNGTVNFISPVTVAGSGQFNMNNGILNVNAAFTVGGTSTTGTSTNTAAINSSSAGPITFTGRWTLNLTTATLSGLLTCGEKLYCSNGTSNLVTNASTNSIAGTVEAHSGSNLNWTGTGTTNCLGGTESYVSSTTNSATITIGSGITLNFNNQNVKCDAYASGSSYCGYFVNNGTLNFTGSAKIFSDNYNNSLTCATNNLGGIINLTGSASIGLGQYGNFSNAGTINAATGTSVNANNSNTSFTNASTGVLTLNSGSQLNSTGTTSSITNSGSITTASANVNLTGTPYTFTNNKTLSLTSTPVNAGSNSGAFTNSATGTITASASAFSFGLSQTVKNLGSWTATSASNINMNNTAVFQNDGPYDATASTFTIAGTPFTFSNSSTFTLKAASNFSVSNTGTVTNSSTGTFSANASTVTLPNGNGAGLTNAGTFMLKAASTFTASYNGARLDNTGAFSADASQVNITGGPYTINNTSPATFILTNNSPLSVSGNNSIINNTGTFSASASAVGLTGGPITVNNTNPATFTLTNTSPLTLSGNSSIINNTGTFTASSSALGLTGGPITFNNTGSSALTTLTSSPVTIIGNSSTIVNSGTFNATSSAFSMTGGPNSIVNTNTFRIKSSPITMTQNSSFISNTKIFNAILSNISFSGQPSYISNDGTTNSTATTFHITGSTVTIPRSGYINNINSAGFTIDSASFITLGDQGYINNYSSATFNAGSSGGLAATTSCVISTTTNPGGDKTIIDNQATFNLGPTSIITIGNAVSGRTMTVSNSGAGVFTLMSDAYGSASLGASSAVGINRYTGTYNVQRYVRGGSSTYRSYRLLASPVNTGGVINGAGNIGFTYLNTTQTVVNANNTIGTVSYPGALTGGPSGATNGFSVAGVNNPTIYLYNEALPTNKTTFTGGKTIGVAAINSTGIKTLIGTTTSSSYVPVQGGNGYIFYFIGDTHDLINLSASARTPENTTITSVGTINQQDYPVTIFSTGSTSMSFAAASGTKGFNLMGNPYASTIDLLKLYQDNLSSAYSTTGGWTTYAELDNKNPNQQYIAYNAATNSASDPTIGSRYVASGQGFFVQATNTAQTFTFKEDIKVYDPTLIAQASTPPLLLVSPAKQQVFASTSTDIKSVLASASQPAEDALGLLHLKFAQDSVNNDWVAVAFGKNFKDKYDNFDSGDLDGATPKIFLSSYTSDGTRTSVNALSEIGAGKRVKLFVKSTVNGLHSISMPDITNINIGKYDIFLVDHFKKDSLNIGLYKIYNFNIDLSDTTTMGPDRFELVISQAPSAKYKLVAFVAKKASDGVLVTWQTNNEANNYSFTLEKQNGNGTDYSPLITSQSNGASNYKFTDKIPNSGNNVYRLKQVDLLGNITYSNAINIYFDNSGNADMFTLYPNPTVEMLNVNVTNGKTSSALSGSYNLNIYDIGGTIVLKKTSDNSAWAENVSKFKPGVYIAELQDSNGSTLGKAKFVKK
jgi:hypothetical protein